MKMVIPCCAALLFLPPPAGADPSIQERFAEAQSIFDSAKGALTKTDSDIITARRQFYDAATRFADLAREGVSSVNLYVNTGNAFHFAGDDARALLWYLRANRLSNTSETRNGLIALRNACNAEPWPHDPGSIWRALMFWHYDLTQPLKHWILLATYPLGSVMLLIAVFVRRRTLWIRLGIALMVVGAAMGVSDLVARATGNGQWAVVLADGKGYAGDGEGYSVVVEHVAPGQEVKIIESREKWVHAELPTGTRCWLPADICEEV
jgi:hypothetical protein